MSGPNYVHNSVHNSKNGDDYVEDPDPITLISKLDISDPLHLHPNDSNALTVVLIKLKRTENYQVWSCAMLLNLEGKNKTGFIDGSCKRSNTDEVLVRNLTGLLLVVLLVPLKGIKLLPLQGWGSGLVCENYGFNGHTIDRCFKIISYPADFGKKKSNQSFKGRNVSNNNAVGTNSSSGFTDEQMATLISLIKDNKNGKNAHANMAELVCNGKIVNSWASQHMTYIDKELDNVLDISHLKIKVGYPNGTEDFISKIGNLKLSNGLILLGHPAEPVLNVLKKSLQIDNNDKNICCEVCQRAKQTREPFPLSDHVSSSLGELVHLDLWGSYKVTSSEGFRYFLTVVDDYTRAVWVYLIKSKDEVSHFVIIFYNLIENQFKRKIKVFRSDNGIEFVNQTVNKFCADKGIIHQTSCAYTPQQNGIAERKHRHLLNDSDKLKNDTANVFQDVNQINLFDVKYPEIPNDDERVNPNLNSDLRSQSDSISSSESGNGVNTADFPVNNSRNDVDSSDDIVATQNEEVVTLEENIFSKGNLNLNQINSQGVQPVRRSSRQSVFPKNYNDFVIDSKVKYGLEKYVGYSKLNSKNYCFVTQLNKNSEPKSYFEASKYSHWIDAMNQEMDALLRNGTWEIVELREGRKAIGSQGGPNRYQIKHPWIRQFNNDRDHRDIITYGASSNSTVIFGNRWRHILGERDFWEHVGGIDVYLASSSFGQANTRVRNYPRWRTVHSIDGIVFILHAFDSLLQKLHKYVPLGASVTDLYTGAGVIELSVRCVEINKESKLAFEKTIERLPSSLDSSISWHHADTSLVSIKAFLFTFLLLFSLIGHMNLESIISYMNA
ncbi:ribonuclease H-like domain-containing protein [Tanacetum coccineum]